MPVLDCENRGHAEAPPPAQVPQHVAVSALSRMWGRVLAARSLREDGLTADISAKLTPATLRGANDRAAAGGLPRGLRHPGLRRRPAAVAASLGDRGLAGGDAAQRDLLVGFNLPLAWINAATGLTFLVLAWTVQKGSSRTPSPGGRSSV
jgi:hypothetical protein